MNAASAHGVVTTILQALCAELGGWPKKAGRGWNVRCPAHDDRSPSLNIATGTSGRILVRCYAGCPQARVIEELRRRGLWEGSERDPNFTPRPKRDDTPHMRTHREKDAQVARKLVAVYSYTDEQGSLLYQVLRYDPKGFTQRRPDGQGGYIWNLEGVRKVLYRLPDVIAAQRVFICEGEKDCETLRKCGLVGTTNPGGAGCWRDEYSPFLKDKHVFICPDTDGIGMDHANQVIESIYDYARSITMLEPLPEKDLTEWFEAGHTRDELLRAIREVIS